ncbi:hypothetical protein [Halopseudomonas pelagia]|uniref:Lipoprotein n=1 Tax=Halopseudomonas pelagia TaxID=553151 RepID=A0AA91TZ83_9GAMM|nr:hypothetical protein [Halopseudomonas pelagia]PCC97573.1 hypothetical protein CO192_20150 [Halopseudomonas pelagia]QFY57888.1 hypothetical protein EAO82_16865 [Halopseudomonas pelagia]
MSSKYVNFSRFGLLLVVVAMAGCAILPGARQEPGERLTGTLTAESGGLRLLPCDGSNAMAVADSANIQQLFEQVVHPGRQSVFVDMAVRTLTDGAVEPVEVIRLQQELSGCADQSHARTQWSVVGNGLEWRMQIGPAGMQWLDQGTDSIALPVPVITEEIPGSAIGFQTLRGDSQELWLYPDGCFEQSSGDYFHRTARLVRDGQTLTGCAYQGLLP